jgi:hydroxymethylglutaryl-CoA lyase
VEIIEVCPRDGFQNIKTQIPTQLKLEIINKLVACGFTSIEATSFVHPKAIPQMADAAAVLKAVKQAHAGNVNFIALAPNLYGAERAIEAGADAITFVISASEAHNLANTKQTIAESVAAFGEVCKIKADRKLRLAVATAFDCPFAGAVAPEQVIRLVEAGLAAGADDIVLADTIGTASPCQVETVLVRLADKQPQLSPILHIHDTQGMGLACVLTALQLGVSRFEAAAFGLGGCPFAPGAAGNIATEDMVNMLHKLGVDTGLDAEKLMQAARFIGDSLGTEPAGHMARVASCQGG